MAQIVNNQPFAAQGLGAPCGDNSTISGVTGANFLALLQKNASLGTTFSQGIVSTYSLVYTTGSAYKGGVLSPNGDIHFVPYYATVGQKISSTGFVSTYSLVYTTGNAYEGGVLSPNGDIHFVPSYATVGQKINTLSPPFSRGICLSPFLNKF